MNGTINGAHTRNEVYEKVAILDQSVKSIASGQDKLVIAVERLNARLDDLKQTNWPVVLSAILVGLTMLGAGATIIRQQTENTVLTHINDYQKDQAVLNNTMRSELAQNGARDERSEEDRKKLNMETERNAEAIGKIQAEIQVTTARLSEVETQFRKGDNERNIQFAEQQRANNLILQIAQGVKPIRYPENPYFMPQSTPPTER